jgi:hypothetical protein
MQEEKENNKNTSLVPIGSKGLVRLRNSIAITEKILKESTLSFFQQFNGELYKTIEINQETYYNLLLKQNDEVYFINKYGNIIKIDIQNGSFLEIKTLYNSLKNKKEVTEDIFYNPNQICSYFKGGDEIYISNGYEEVFIYRIDDNSLNIKKLNQNIGNTEIFAFYSFFPIGNLIFSYCNEFHFEEYSQEYSMDVRFIKLFNKDSFELLKHFKAIDDFFYFNLSYSQGYVFAINENGLEEYKGKILKQSIIDYSHSFINAFENSWVEDYKILIDNTIICYSNYVFGENDSLLKIIDSSNNKVLFEIEFKEIIRSFSLSENKSVLALLFNNGEVLLFSIKNHQLEQFRQFHYNELVDTDYEVYPIHIHPPPIFEILTNELIIGNRKQINIYS